VHRHDVLGDLPAHTRELLRQGDAALRAGNRSQSLQCARAALQEVPRHAEPLRLLAAALAAHGPSEEAERAIAAALELRPGDPALFATQAVVLQTNGRLDAAIESFRAACALAPQSANHAYNLGRALSHRDDNVESLQMLERALALDPAHRHARATLAEVLRRIGRTDAAIAQFRELLRRNPGDARVWSALATLNAGAFDTADIAVMERLQSDPRVDADARVGLGFSLGRAYAGHARYADAYAAYMRANALVRARVPWNAAAHSHAVDALLRAFTQAPAPGTDLSGNEMIFIVSLPRSGSTLTEQILAAHPQVDAGEERTDLLETISAENRRRGCSLAAWAGEAAADDWRRLGEDYLTRTARWRSGRARATDKLPSNWLWLGALLRMLPGARVVDCRRDRLETAWSCYCHLFAIGTQDFSFDFDSIAAYARDYERAMVQWNALYPRSIRTQSYEALLAEPETQTRELLAFCGLEFDAACLRPQDAQRSVRTASASQVRESLRRDTARTAAYGALLDPLRTALGLPPFQGP
jgi:tetratricopeptide (TPR) repeat protein